MMNQRRASTRAAALQASKPSWDLLSAFAAVMRSGSLSGAARELGLAQPTVRRQIEELEGALGCVLFTRSKAGLTPTSAARDTAPYAETMSATADALVRTASGERHSAKGVVRVSCSEVVGYEVLPSLLAPFAQLHPGVEFELSATDRIEDVLRGDADLAIRMLRPTQSSLVARRACSIEIGLFASETYLALHPAPVTLEGLSEHRLVGDDRGRGVITALAQHGLKLTRRDFSYRSDSGVAQIAAVRAGLGIGPCQVPLARKTQPALRRVLPSVRVRLDTWVVMHEDLKHVRRNKLVFDTLVDSLAAYAAHR
jgi:DNA-binding transcriptional LysR family regulator